MRLIAGVVLLLCIAAFPASAADWTVIVGGYDFDPAPITIAKGDSVHWIWDCGKSSHSTTSDPNQAESWDSGRHSTGAKPFVFDHTFTHVGTFAYHCSTHASMRGQVIVAPESSNMLGAGPRSQYSAWVMFIESVIRQMDSAQRNAK